jgi:cyclophilin family peptidyl-prolyl cis-trans isomerase
MSAVSATLMGVPEGLKNIWAEAANLIDNGNANQAVKLLRDEAWNLSDSDSDKAKTCQLAADAFVELGSENDNQQKKNWQSAYKNYNNSLTFEPKNKDVRRSLNQLIGMMDEAGISLGTSLQFFDDGSPTPTGLVVILLAGIMLLVGLKYAGGIINQEETLTATMEISYVPADGDESDRTTALITIELFEDKAPDHIDNFIRLSDSGAYDHTIFHRVIDNFMIQGGDFDGSGGHAAQWYGYCNGEAMNSQGVPHTSETCRMEDWTLGDEATNGLLHTPGALAMAKTSADNTGGSQFYIVPSDSTPSHLDGIHTVFGMVIAGLDDVTAISDVSTDGEANSSPVHEVRLLSVDIN